MLRCRRHRSPGVAPRCGCCIESETVSARAPASCLAAATVPSHKHAIGQAHSYEATACLCDCQLRSIPRIVKSLAVPGRIVETTPLPGVFSTLRRRPMRQEPISMAGVLARLAVLGKFCPTSACAGLCRATSEHRRAWAQSISTERVAQSSCSHKPLALYGEVQPNTSRIPTGDYARVGGVNVRKQRPYPVGESRHQR